MQPAIIVDEVTEGKRGWFMSGLRGKRGRGCILPKPVVFLWNKLFWLFFWTVQIHYFNF